jgi:hypothetical protein
MHMLPFDSGLMGVLCIVFNNCISFVFRVFTNRIKFLIATHINDNYYKPGLLVFK